MERKRLGTMMHRRLFKFEEISQEQWIKIAKNNHELTDPAWRSLSLPERQMYVVLAKRHCQALQDEYDNIMHHVKELLYDT